jgi:cell division control protein 6
MEQETTNVFEQFAEVKPIFRKDRDILRPSYIPDSLPHRTKQIEALASILATALQGNRPSNVLIFGKTGTGKTAVVKYLGKEIRSAHEHNEGRFSEVNFIYINCQVVDTHYGVLAHVGNYFIQDWDSRIPFTGWSTEKVYNELKQQIDANKTVTVIVLDEIDKLVYKSGDDVLFHLSELNDDLKRGKLSIIGISNDLKFTEFLDTRVRSRLGEERLVFPPYNANQLQDILRQRADLAFFSNALDPAVISLCSALAAQEHGDARRALDLLRVSAELAERDHSPTVSENYVQKAVSKLELDAVEEVVSTLPTHSKLVLLGIYINERDGASQSTTGEVYDTYRELCRQLSMAHLTQRRVTDLISELDMLGIINARLKSFGRGGRTREISLAVSMYEIADVLRQDDVVKDLLDARPHQTTLL